MTEPCKIFADMWSDKGRMSVERNSDIEHGGDGGIWMCVQNQKTDSTASLNLSDADALELAAFLVEIVKTRKDN